MLQNCIADKDSALDHVHVLHVLGQFLDGNIRFYKGCAVAVAHPFIGFIPGSFQPVPLFLSQVFT